MNMKLFTSSMQAISLAAVMTVGLAGCDGDKAEELQSIVKDSERGLSSLSISTANVALAVGDSMQMSVRGNYYSGIDAEFLEPVEWVSHDPAVATVGSNGDITAVSEGATEIHVTWRTYSATTNVTVNEAALQSIEVSSPSLEMDACRSANLSATGIYSDGTSRPLSDSVSWLLADATLGSIEIDLDSSITLTSLGQGSTRLDVSVENVNASVPVVMLDTLASIAITPDLPTLSPGKQVALTAIGSYSDGLEFDISGSALWQLLDAMPDASIAELDPASLIPKKLDTHDVGTATLEVSCGDVSATTPIAIALTPVLETLQVANGVEVDMNPGDAVTLQVFGAYTDGSTEDLSLLVDWALPVTDALPFTLSTSDTSTGIITADQDIIVEQSTVANASYEGLTATTTVYVNRGVEDTLQSLEVTLVDSLGNESAAPVDAPYIVAVGELVQLHVNAVYLTGSERVPDVDIFWSNADPSIATVDGQGLVSAIAEGKSIISASFGGLTFSVPVSVVVPD